MQHLVGLILIAAWVFGVAVAEGFVAFLSFIFPPLAWIQLAMWVIEKGYL